MKRGIEQTIDSSTPSVTLISSGVGYVTPKTKILRNLGTLAAMGAYLFSDSYDIFKICGQFHRSFSFFSLASFA